MQVSEESNGILELTVQKNDSRWGRRKGRSWEVLGIPGERGWWPKTKVLAEEVVRCGQF